MKTIAGKLQMIADLYIPQVDEDGVAHPPMLELSKQEITEILKINLPQGSDMKLYPIKNNLGEIIEYGTVTSKIALSNYAGYVIGINNLPTNILISYIDYFKLPDQTFCKDCGVETKSGSGSARCPSCWDDKCGHSTDE